MTSTVFSNPLIYLIISSWYYDHPFDESITSKSTPAAINALALSLSASLVPIAAPTFKHLF